MVAIKKWALESWIQPAGAVAHWADPSVGGYRRGAPCFGSTV